MTVETAHNLVGSRRTLRIRLHGQGYHCHLEGAPGVWGYGITPLGSIGDCVNAHREVFGVKNITNPSMEMRGRTFRASIDGQDTYAKGTSYMEAIGGIVERHLGKFGLGMIIWPDEDQGHSCDIHISIQLEEAA